MTRKQVARCLKCFTIADPVCECGAVASKTVEAFCGEAQLVVYAEHFTEWEVVWAWYNDEEELQYTKEVPGKEAAERVALPDEAYKNITKELRHEH